MIVLPKLIIIRGNSGSGKTTLAREIHNRLPRNTLLISQDTVRRDMLRVKDGKNTLGLPLFKDLLQYGYQYCNYVILEGILNAEWYEPLFKLAQQLFGDEIFEKNAILRKKLGKIAFNDPIKLEFLNSTSQEFMENYIDNLYRIEINRK